MGESPHAVGELCSCAGSHMQQGGLVLHNHSSLAPGKDYSSCKGTCSIPRSRKSRQDADRLSRLRKGCLVNLPLRAPLRALLCASLRIPYILPYVLLGGVGRHATPYLPPQLS